MHDRTPEEKRWLAAVESGSVGVWDLDPRLEVVHYAPTWKSRLGFPRIHEVDSTGFWRCRVHPHDFDAMLRALRSHLDGSLPTYEARFRLRSNGSGYRTVISRGRVVARDARGGASRIVGTMVDISDRPLAGAGHGLVTEDLAHVIEATRLPFHAVLATRRSPFVDGRSTAAANATVAVPTDGIETLRIVDQVHDLLDRAVRDSLADAQRLASHRGRW